MIVWNASHRVTRMRKPPTAAAHRCMVRGFYACSRHGATGRDVREASCGSGSNTPMTVALGARLRYGTARMHWAVALFLIVAATQEALAGTPTRPDLIL